MKKTLYKLTFCAVLFATLLMGQSLKADGGPLPPPQQQQPVPVAVPDPVPVPPPPPAPPDQLSELIKAILHLLGM